MVIAAGAAADDHSLLDMFSGTVLVALVVAIAIAGSFIALVPPWLRARGKRLVTCPETKQPVGVEIDALTAARTQLLDRPRFVISACTRWPEREGCDQACVPQVVTSPRETLVRNIVADWYRGKHCIYCGNAIGKLTGSVVPAVRSVDGVLREWNTISPDTLPALLDTAVAVCAHCEIAEDFRKRFPNLVTDRAATPLRNRAIY